MTDRSDDIFGLAFEDLPDNLPLFPLPGALLLPGGRLPLNIFEPRYLSMVMDSLKESRMIGMVQPTEMIGDPVPEDAELYPVGCAGRLIGFSETDDGRLLISLQGVCRFRLSEEIDTRDEYRRVEPDYTPFRNDMGMVDIGIDRKGVNLLVREYFESQNIQADFQALEQIDDRLLIAALGMMCPFDYREKQALLEAVDLAEMATILISLMEMTVKTGGDITTEH